MNQSFLFFELIGVFIVHWLILEPQTYVVVEKFGAENIPLLSGRLVYYFMQSFDESGKWQTLKKIEIPHICIFWALANLIRNRKPHTINRTAN